MSRFNKIKQLFNLDFEINPGPIHSKSDNILVLKANQLHEILIYLNWIYSIVFTAMNWYNGHTVLALLTFLVFPLTIITYVLFRSGYILASKVWNLSQLNFVISALAMNTSKEGAITVFFIPIIVGTLITLQGNERIYGYVMATITLGLLAGLLAFDVGVPDQEFNPEALRSERLLNITSASVATVVEVIFILRLSDSFQDKLIDRTQELQDKNNDLIKANSELDNFVYRVSHDLRSPLLSVKGLLSLVFQQSNLDSKNLEYLKRADTSINRLDDIIREILEYSRNSRLTLKLEQFDLRRMTELIFEDLRYLAGPKFLFELSINGTNEIVSDSYRINTVLRNVISNSVKYQRKDISDPKVTVAVEKSPKTLKIEVSDNGEGITEEGLPKVFKMFYRGTKTSVGTGLGLYICKEVIEKLDGSIKIHSKIGAGTTVTIELPVKNL